MVTFFYQSIYSNMKNYSFWIGLQKSVINLMIVGLPLIMGVFPTYANLTISGAILLIVNYLKVAYRD